MSSNSRVLHPNLKAYVECVVKHDFGIGKCHKAKININGPNSELNRITVSIPYCQQNLRWDIVFDLENFYCPPDIFGLDTVAESLPVDDMVNALPSLCNWCPEKESCLLDVILELINLHKLTQLQRLKENEDLSRQLFEYETLTTMGNINQDDIEVSVGSLPRGAMIVEFQIGLKCEDAEQIELRRKNANSSSAFLLVTYRIPGNTCVDLKIASDLDDFIGGFELPQLPADSALINYIPHIELKIGDKINSGLDARKFKELYFCELLSRIGDLILDADIVEFSKLSFLIPSIDKEIVGQIEIPRAFPREDVCIKLQDTNQGLKEKKLHLQGCCDPKKMAMQTLKAFGSKNRS